MKKLYFTIFILVAATTITIAQECASVSDEPGTAIISGVPTPVTISVPDDVSITDINLSLNITHAFIEDLEISLVSPEGTMVTIINQNCGGGNISTTFDDQGAPLICSTGLNTPTAQPVGSFSDFNNDASAQGDWTLLIVDAFPTDDGTLNSYSLEYCTDEVLSIDDQTLTAVDMFYNVNSNLFEINSVDISNYELSVYNIQGKNVLTETFETSATFNTSNLSSGIYIAKVENDLGVSKTLKFVKN